MTTIPASEIVNITPGVLAAGGSSLDLNGLILTGGSRVPIGSVASFPSAATVSAYFGGAATETALAAIYFSGFNDSSVKPGALLFAQYNEDDVAAFLRGGDISDLTVAELQALSGLLALTIDGALESASVNLATATSFSSAAGLIAAGLGIVGAAGAAVTGSITGTTLTVSAVTSGALAVNSVLAGTGVTAGTYILAQLSGTTGGVGTYTVSASQSAASQAITATNPAVSFDSVSGGFIIVSPTTGEDSSITFGSGALATSLLLTSLTGAVISQGADAAVPGAFMTALTLLTQNFATWMTAFDPDSGGGTTNRLAFAAWNSSKNNRYSYAAWDTDASPTTTVPATTSLGYLVDAADYAGVQTIWAVSAAEGMNKAAFVLGIAASLDTEETEGRATYKFRKQDGLIGDVSDQAIYTNLLANGYNFYGAFGTANDEFVFWTDGSISGSFLWADTYIDQIWMNNAFQLALMVLVTTARSIPYNAAGRAMIEQALQDPINGALNFGAIRPGVTLSASQASAVNISAGVRISDTLQQVGFYLQVLDASAAVRQARGSPPCKFWYTDGQSVQSIDLSSVAVL